LPVVLALLHFSVQSEFVNNETRAAAEAAAVATAAAAAEGISGAPAADDFLAQHEQMMRSQGHSGGVSARQRRQMRASQRERANASRSRHPLAASRADAAGEEELVMQGDHTIQTCEVLASNVEGLALNAGGGDDYCPICWTPWGEFADSSTLAVVLPL
jgi:hypothetical protein